MSHIIVEDIEQFIYHIICQVILTSITLIIGLVMITPFFSIILLTNLPLLLERNIQKIVIYLHYFNRVRSNYNGIRFVRSNGAEKIMLYVN